MSGVDSLFSRLGEYIDHYLQPLAQKCSSHLRESKQLNNILDSFPPEDNLILATIDVDSMYTNIQQDDALEANTWEFFVEALELAMKSNYFWHKILLSPTQRCSHGCKVCT